MPTYNPIALSRTASTIAALSPKLWLNTHYNYGGVTASGSVATYLTDFSGNGNHFTQTTTAYKPTIVPNGKNSKTVLRFDGTNDFMRTIAGVDAFKFMQNSGSTTFIVHKPWTTANPNSVSYLLDNVTLAGSVGSRYGFYFRPDDRSGSGFNDAIIAVTTSSSPTIVGTTAQNDIMTSNTWQITVIQMDPTNGTAANRLYVAKNNGAWTQGNATGGTPGSTSPTYQLTLGAASGDGSQPYTGDVASIVNFNSLLSAGNITTVLTALNSDWGIY